MRSMPRSGSLANCTHPCFSAEAGKLFGRVHLAVAPGCNIQCRYCRREYDCLNESRPGVASKLLQPEDAAEHLNEMKSLMPYISVAGIAGPGDAFCEPERTLLTLELVRRRHPRLDLCISTNGLNITPWIGELARLGVAFITITINAVNPRIGAKIYEYVQDGAGLLRGLEAAHMLLDRQLEAICSLKAQGMILKINSVVLPGINDSHIKEVARRTAAFGADIMNVIGVIPVRGTPLAHVSPPSDRVLSAIRQGAGEFLPQMRHCVRCRSDAAGLLGCRGKTNTGELVIGSSAGRY